MEHTKKKTLMYVKMCLFDLTLNQSLKKNVHDSGNFQVISRQQLPKRHLKNLIASRKQLLSMSSFCDLEDIEKYAELSVSSIYYLILEGSGIKNVNADHAVSHLGKSQGIVQQIR